MKIYIEGIILFSIMFLFFVWYIWFALSRRRLRKKYNPNDNKTRNGRFHREGNQTPSRTGESFSRHEFVERREFIPTTKTHLSGKTSDSIGEKQSAVRRIFRRRARRK